MKNSALARHYKDLGTIKEDSSAFSQDFDESSGSEEMSNHEQEVRANPANRKSK